MEESADFILSMRNIRVLYQDLQALKGVDFDLRAGEVHAVVGEHRAGKSSLVGILSGAVQPAGGEIILFGKRLSGLSPKQAMSNRIAIVYQYTSIIPSLSAAENLFAGRFSLGCFHTLRFSPMLAEAKRVFSEMGVKVDLKTPVGFLSKAEQHMVELARALLLSPSILILDEISSKLTPQEMEIVYRIIRDYKREGKSIIYISHNMDEIFEFADRVTVLKDGIRRGTEEITNIDRVKLINLTYSFVLSREELTQTNIELYNYKKYNEDIIKNLPVGVIILGPDGKVYLANYSAVLILSVEQEELSERGLDTFLPRMESGVADEVKKAVTGMERRSWEEVRFGEDKILKLTIFPFVDEKTAHLGTILLVEDVSKDFHIKNYLIRAEKVASVAELAAGVAHEINNPLGIMANYLEIVKQRQLPGDVREKVQKMENELHRIVDIIGSLLSFSRIADYPMRSVPLFSVVREAVLLLRHRIEAKGIHFSSDMGDEETFILGDENKLKQVFINLIMNSIEAVLDGGEVSVLHEIDRENGIAEVMIADNGYGIPEDIRNRIFDPFFSTKATKTNTGLGLSICQHIVEAYHGIISCASSPGRTIFTVSLPLAPPEGQAR